MTIGDATCFWLHTLGLRDGLATDDHRALNPEEHENRVQGVSDVRPEDCGHGCTHAYNGIVYR